MHKVDAPGATPANEFTDGDPQSGVPATTLEAKFMNTVQRELTNVVEQESIELDDQDDTQIYQALSAMMNKTIAPGSRILFVQAAAPAGWTQDNSLNDRVIRVVNAKGGGVGGSWTLTGLTYSHTHTYRGTTQAPNSAQGFDYDRGIYNFSWPTIRHGHSYSGTTQPPSSLAVQSNGEWRPAYVDVITCIKN